MKNFRSIITFLCLGITFILSAQDASFYMKYADKGDKEAMYNLADCYMNGTGGVAQDYTTAAMWLSKAAKKNYAPAQNDLALCYIYGLGVLKDYKKAWELFNKAQKQGYAASSKYIAQMYKEGLYVTKNDSLYLHYLREAAQRNDTEALAELGRMYMLGNSEYGITPDTEIGISYLKPAAEEGNADALLFMGICYEEGIGSIQKDEPKAFEYFYKSAQGGSNYAHYKVGHAYSYGIGVAQNASEGFKFAQYAAQQGVSAAYNLMGEYYYYGFGVNQDYSLAESWYLKSVEADDEPNACMRLANMYIFGVGVEEDKQKGFELAQKAADGNNVGGFAILGICYENGYAVAEDITKAISYYNTAAEMNDSYSQYRLYSIYRHNEDIEKDDKLAMQYLRDAFENGNNDAIFQLGYEYYIGEIVHKEESLAKKYFIKAADNGHANAAAVVGTMYYSGKYLFDKDYNLAYKYLDIAAANPENVGYKILTDVYRNLGACHRFGRGTEVNPGLAAYYTEKANENALKYGDSDLDDVLNLMRNN